MKGTTPRGLSTNIQPSVPFTDTELIIQWEKIKLDFQSKLLVALAEYWKRYKTKLQKELSKLEKSLKANSVEEEWSKMEEILIKVQTATQERYKNKTRTNPARRKETENSSRGPSGSEERRRPTRRTGTRNQTTN
jgi:hypothetical protein